MPITRRKAPASRLDARFQKLDPKSLSRNQVRGSPLSPELKLYALWRVSKGVTSTDIARETGIRLYKKSAHSLIGTYVRECMANPYLVARAGYLVRTAEAWACVDCLKSFPNPDDGVEHVWRHVFDAGFHTRDPKLDNLPGVPRPKPGWRTVDQLREIGRQALARENGPRP